MPFHGRRVILSSQNAQNVNTTSNAMPIRKMLPYDFFSSAWSIPRSAIPSTSHYFALKRAAQRKDPDTDQGQHDFFCHRKVLSDSHKQGVTHVGETQGLENLSNVKHQML